MSKPRKEHPVRRWVLRILLLLVVAFATWWIWAWNAGRLVVSPETTVLTEPLTGDGLVNYVAAVDARLAEGITPDNNAAVPLVLEVYGPETIDIEVRQATLDKLGIRAVPPRSDYFVLLEDFGPPEEAEPDEPPDAVPPPSARLPMGSDDQLAEALKAPWTADQYPAIDKWLAANRGPLDRAVAATKRDRYYWPMATAEDPWMLEVLLPSLRYHRNLAKALTVRAMRSAGAGDIDAATRDLLAVLDLSRHLDDQNTLIDQMVATAVHTLGVRGCQALAAGGRLSADQADALLGAVRARRPTVDVADSVDICERYMMLDTMQRFALGRLDFTSWNSIGGSRGQAIAMKYLPINWNWILRNANDWYDRMVDAMRRSAWADCRKAMDEWQQSFDRKVKDSGGTWKIPTTKAVLDSMLAVLMPALDSACEVRFRLEAEHGLAETALALAAHKTRQGTYPDKLSDLGQPAGRPLPLDTFTDKPFIYKRTADGYLLYSLGPDMTDEGGIDREKAAGGSWDMPLRVPPTTQPGE